MDSRFLILEVSSEQDDFIREIAQQRGVSVQTVLQDLIGHAYGASKPYEVMPSNTAYSRFRSPTRARHGAKVRGDLQTTRPDDVTLSSEPEFPEFRRSEQR